MIDPHVPVVAELRCARFLSGGWAPASAQRFRAIGAVACLRFPLPPTGEPDHVLLVRCSPECGVGLDICREVQVVVNDLAVGQWAVQRDETFSALVPSAMWWGKDSVVVELSVADSAASADGKACGSAMLGLLLIDADFVPLAKAPVQLSWLGAGGDPVGRVFSRNGYAWRGIYTEAVPTVKALAERGIYTALAERALIPPNDFMDISHGRFGMVARTRAAMWPLVPANFTLEAIRDAAFTWLSINALLLDSQAQNLEQLTDGHCGNFALFERSRPRWVDLGSICVVQDLFGYRQFVQCLLFPLLVAHRDPDKIARVRKLLLMQGDGLSVEDMRALGAGDLAEPWLAEVVRTPLDKGCLRALLQRLVGVIGSVSFERVGNFWSDYRVPGELDAAWQGHYARNHPDSRFRTVAGLAVQLQVSTFIDIGCNDGIFSLLFAREGLSGLALDTDEASLNKLYQFVGENSGAHVVAAHGAFPDVQYVADLVICLALTHHLALSQGMGFVAIAEKLASMCTRALITEFMPDGLGGTADIPEPYPNPLPDWYGLEDFLGAHRQFFGSVSVIEYVRESAPSRRVLVLCQNPLG